MDASRTRQIAGASPHRKARLAGGLYLLTLATAAFTETFVRGKLNYVGGYIAILGMAAVTVILYDIFKPVNKRVASLAAFFSFIGLLFEAFRWQPQGVNLAIVFNGLFCLLIGYLVLKSTFLPRIPGALMALAGLAWLTFLSHSLANYLSPYNLACGVLGQAGMMLWLLIRGVNTERWNEQRNSGLRSSPTLGRIA